MAPAASITYRRLASMIAEKRKQSYSMSICMIRCQISFALIRSAVRCLRGFRSSRGIPKEVSTIEDMRVTMAESQMECDYAC
jgi:hypothetical protein